MPKFKTCPECKGPGVSWLEAQPVLYVAGAALLIGLALGAWLDRLVVALIIGGLGVFALWRRPEPQPQPQPPVTPRTRRVSPIPKRSFDDIIRESQRP